VSAETVPGSRIIAHSVTSPSMSSGVAVIVLAGGSGSRLQQEINKVYLPIGDRVMLHYSLATIAASPEVDRIVLVIRPEDRETAGEVVSDLDVDLPVELVVGGNSRHGSERAGLEALAGAIDDESVSIVAIHDGARPFMSAELLHSVLEGARRSGGAVPGMPVEEALYRVSGEGAHPLDPSTLVKVQTPQAFAARPLLAAYRKADEAGFEGVDTAETVERFSDLEVEVVPGDPMNLKVTFIEDFFAAEEYALDWAETGWRRPD
jgi:2-C-methyl-D-erythritol 4-phosphate cytidylyltransferase